MNETNDYELLQESIKVAAEHIAPIIAKYELDLRDQSVRHAFAEAFQAGVEYAVSEMKGTV